MSPKTNTPDSQIHDQALALVRERLSTADLRTERLEATDEEEITIRLVVVESTRILAAGDGPSREQAVRDLVVVVEQSAAVVLEPYLGEREERLRGAYDQMVGERNALAEEVTRQRKIVDKLVGVTS